MSQKPDYDRGWHDGIRCAVTWLHNRAAEMNDPHARALYNSAAFHLGSDASPRMPRKRTPYKPVGFFASLTPEQQAAALAYRGPENIGPDDLKFRPATESSPCMERS